MKTRSFLDLAKRLVIIPHEANWRCATGRAYYALVLESRDALARWGFRFLKSDSIHFFTRPRFSNTSIQSLRLIGSALDQLSRLRGIADYEMNAVEFANDGRAREAVKRAEIAIDLLDVIQSDTVELAAAIAEIRSRCP